MGNENAGSVVSGGSGKRDVKWVLLIHAARKRQSHQRPLAKWNISQSHRRVRSITQRTTSCCRYKTDTVSEGSLYFRFLSPTKRVTMKIMGTALNVVRVKFSPALSQIPAFEKDTTYDGHVEHRAKLPMNLTGNVNLVYIYWILWKLKQVLMGETTRISSGDKTTNVNLLYDDIVHALQNTIDSYINSATDRRGYVLEPRFTKFSEITQYNGLYAVQGHSRSPILVPIESSYTTSYYWLILTYLLFCTVSTLWLINGQIFASEWECLTLTLMLGVIPCQYRHKWYIVKN